jgi:hypothetical protein
MIALVIGAAYCAGAAFTAIRAFTMLAEIRQHRWPMLTAEAAIYALLGVTILAGATLHSAGIFYGALVTLGFLFGNYDSESVLAPLVFVSIPLLLFCYRRSRNGKLGALTPVRWAMLVLSAAFAVTAFARMEEPGQIVLWQHVRNASGAAEVRTFVFTSTCGAQRGAALDEDEIGRGCADVIPARRALFVTGFAGAAARLAVAAVAGAALVRRRDEEAPDAAEPLLARRSQSS